MPGATVPIRSRAAHRTPSLRYAMSTAAESLTSCSHPAMPSGSPLTSDPDGPGRGHSISPTASIQRRSVRHIARRLVLRQTDDVDPPGGCQRGCQRPRTSTDVGGRLRTETLGVPDVYGRQRTSTDAAHLLCKQGVVGSIPISSTEISTKSDLRHSLEGSAGSQTRGHRARRRAS